MNNTVGCGAVSVEGCQGVKAQQTKPRTALATAPTRCTGTVTAMTANSSSQPPMFTGGGELPKRLSPSRASDFRQCPQKFYYRSVLRLQDPPNRYQARGTLTHTVLEKLFELPAAERTRESADTILKVEWPKVRNSEKYRAIFEKAAEAGDLPGATQDPDEFYAEVESMLDGYFAMEDPSTIEPHDQEMWMNAELLGVPMVGILDRVDMNEDGSFVISDYKTGKPPKPEYERKAFFGLRVYAALWRQLHDGTAPASVRLLFLGASETLTLDVNDQMCDAVEREVRAVWRAINRAHRTNQWPARKQVLCQWCSYQGICPAWNPELEQVSIDEIETGPEIFNAGTHRRKKQQRQRRVS